MFIRMMSSVVAASALVTAAPALAREPGDADATHPQRCECAAMQLREPHGRGEATEKQKATSDRAEQKNAPGVNEAPFGWDPSWGG